MRFASYRWGRLLMAWACLLSCMMGHVRADDALTLVEDGQPRVSIHVQADRTPLIDRAVQSLLEAFQVASETQPAVDPSTPAGSQIILHEPTQAPMFSLAAQRIEIRTEGSVIHLQGGSDAAILWAATTFARKALDVGWPTNGPAQRIGELRKTIAIAPINLTDEPGLLRRGMHMLGSHQDPQFDHATGDWMAHNRMNMKLTHQFHFPRVYEALVSRGIEPNTNAHSYFWLVPSELFEKHPQWFPIVNGQRIRKAGHGGVGMQLTVSGEGLADHIAGMAKQWFRKYPHMQTFGVFPNDGPDGWSEDPGDLEIDGPQRGTGVYSNRVVWLANEVARRTAEEFPDKYIGISAYSKYREPPTIDIHPNVLVSFTTMKRNYLRSIADESDENNRELMTLLKAWMAKAKHVELYEYYSSGDIGIGYLPMPVWRTLTEEYAQLKAMGVEGVYSEMMVASSFLPTTSITMYFLARASWDPSAKFEDILEDYCQLTYGQAAAPAMREYWLAYEGTIRSKVKNLGFGTPVTDVLKALDTATISRMRRLTEQAWGAVEKAGSPQQMKAVSNQRALSLQVEIAVSDPARLPYVGKNLLHNPSMEDSTTNVPGWFSNVNQGKYETVLDRRVARTGRQSLRITAKEQGWARWMQSVPTTPGKTYLFAVWVKASQGASGLVWAHQGSSHTDGALLKFGPTQGRWQRITIPAIKANSGSITLFLEHRGEGTVHFDDVYAAEIQLVVPLHD